MTRLAAWIQGMSDPIPVIAKRLIATRLALDMDQAEFAEGAGIARNTYNQWETATGRPSLDEALKLVARYGLTLDWIYLGNPAALPLAVARRLGAAESSSFPDPEGKPRKDGRTRRRA